MPKESRMDLRVLRTRKLLSSTLLAMMEEDSIERISVIDLCDRAMINRATFYAHFEDKYHLLSYALEEMKDNVYQNFIRSNSPADPQAALIGLLTMGAEYFFNNHAHIVNIICCNRDTRVVDTIEESIAQSIRYVIGKFKDTYDVLIPTGVISSYIAGGMIGVALYCIENPDKFTLEDFVEYAKMTISDSFFKPKA